MKEIIQLLRAGSIAWQCDIGSGEWIDYDVTTAVLLERSQENRLPVVFSRQEHMYHVDRNALCHVNTTTGACRTIRRRQFNFSHVEEQLEAERRELKADYAKKEQEKNK